MLAEILGTQAVCPQITFHSSQTVAPDRAHKNQPVKARQRSLQLIPVLGDKLIHRCFPFREILSSNNNIVRERKHLFYLVAAMLLCGAGARSGRVTGIAPRHPPTPPDMRFSASGG